MIQYCVNIVNCVPRLLRTQHEKTYLPGPGISWKAQKDQVYIIFSSTFWLKEDRISHHRKVQSKNFSLISKYHLSINFLTQKRPYFHSQKDQNKNFFVFSKYHISINFLTQKHRIFPLQKIQNNKFLGISKRISC